MQVKVEKVTGIDSEILKQVGTVIEVEECKTKGFYINKDTGDIWHESNLSFPKGGIMEDVV